MKTENELNRGKEIRVWMAFHPNCPEQTYSSEEGETYIGCIDGSRRYNLFLNKNGMRRIASNKYGDLFLGAGYSRVPAAYKGFDIGYQGLHNYTMDSEDEFIMHFLGADEFWVKTEKLRKLFADE